jgi:hypothetical protein
MLDGVPELCQLNMPEADFASPALARHLRQRVICISACFSSARLHVLRVFYNTHTHFRLPRHVRPLPELCRLRQPFAQSILMTVKCA